MAEARPGSQDTNRFRGKEQGLLFPDAPALSRMVEAARETSISRWKQMLPGASDTELEMLYIHLSNGLLNVVVQGYDRYDREEVIRFVNRIVRGSIAMFRGPGDTD